MGDPALFAELVKNLGPVVAVLVYFVWRDYRNVQDAIVRENRMAARLDVLENAHRGELMTLLKNTNQIVVDNTEALRTFSSMVKREVCPWMNRPPEAQR